MGSVFFVSGGVAYWRVGELVSLFLIVRRSWIGD